MNTVQHFELKWHNKSVKFVILFTDAWCDDVTYMYVIKKPNKVCNWLSSLHWSDTVNVYDDLFYVLLFE